MPGLLPDVDPDGLLEFSVVYTDRSLNHMSAKFQGVMRDISATLKQVYHAHSTLVVPGSGSYGMEAVARQFATRQKVLVLRNGWFSYRWSQIFEMGQIPSEERVLKARRIGDGPTAPFAPAPLEEVLATIRSEQPAVSRRRASETRMGAASEGSCVRSVRPAASTERPEIRAKSPAGSGGWGRSPHR